VQTSLYIESHFYEGIYVPVLKWSTTPWRCMGEWRYSSTHS